MQNFIFHNPTKIYFGKGQIAALDAATPVNATILLTYGGGSIKHNGVYEQVKQALGKSSRKVIEFSGIEPNPTYETLMQAVELGRQHKVDFILAVGGGSVIDGTKFIAAAINYTDGDPWEILLQGMGNTAIKNAVPFASVLTLPGTGSEMNCGSVISRKATHDKLAFIDPAVYPQFSILDPTTTYSLPTNQTCNGIVDAFIHVTEQYLTYPMNAPLQDRFAEGVLSTLVEEAAKVLRTPNDYDVRANIMWSATLALNGLLSTGVTTDWATHMIGHELTAQYGIDHAQTLAIVLPSLLRLKKQQKKEKLLQYASRVWNINSGSDEVRIEQAIAATEEFFRSLGMKTKLGEWGIKQDAAEVETIVQKLKRSKRLALGEHGDITLEVSAEILRHCW
jgi:NADP-dependent alcohol dehydrogenase